MFADQGNRKLGPRGFHGIDVPRIGLDIVNNDRAAFPGSGADDSCSE
jgi:hypothetical protein